MKPPDIYEAALATLERMIAEGKQDPPSLLDELRKVIFKYRQEAIARHLIAQHGAVVLNGPFAGMRYLDKSTGGLNLPEVVGCSEAELHGLVGEIVQRGYTRVINIGSARGYYAVGFARLMPQAQVFAFETEPGFQSLSAELARRNQVTDRVHIRGNCTLAELRETAIPGSLIWCDCEGEELTLLNPVEVPALQQCDLVIEAHDFMDAGTSRVLAERFAPSHNVTTIPNGGRNPYQYAGLKNLRQSDQLLSVYEGRPGPTPWLYMRHSS